MRLRLDKTTVPAIADAAEQILGRRHPLVAQIEALAVDDADAHLVYAAFEGLPPAHRRAIAHLASAFLMPRLASPSEELN